MTRIGHNSKGGDGVYAITFDLHMETLRKTYRNDSINNAYSDIKQVLEIYGFHRQQGSVYFGDETVDAVKCVLAVQDCARQHDWFAASVADIRMLRIEDNNDLGPAIEATIKV